MSIDQWDFEMDRFEAAEREEQQLRKRYYEAVGWCLQYKIPVYVPGREGAMKTLGEMEEEIAAHEGRPGRWWWHREIARIQDLREERGHVGPN